MKKNKFRSGIAVVAAAALTLSAGTGLTAFAEGNPWTGWEPFYPTGDQYAYINSPYEYEKDHADRYEPVYVPAAPKRVNSAADAKKAGSKAAELPINSANFPDAVFRAYVSENFDTDNSGGLSDDEINNVTDIYVSKNQGALGNEIISSLKGIEHFPNLARLYCYGNDIRQLDVSNNTALENLICNNNNLKQLDVSNNTALKWLSCDSNNLKQLDVSNNTALTSLDCDFNNLDRLDVSKNTALTFLSCYYNNLTQLDVSKNTALTSLSCYDNNLTQLDVSNNTALKWLSCDSNNLKQLDVSKNTALTSLYCNSNNLTQLDVSNNTALDNLWCNSNNLTQLDVSNNTALTSLYCNSNNLTQLDVSNNTALEDLYCFHNKLTILDVSNNTALKRLSCYYNYFKNKSSIIGLNEDGMTECNCTVQYYEGFKLKDTAYDLSKIQIAMPDKLACDKVLIGRIGGLNFYSEKMQLPDYSMADLKDTVGAPENLVTDDGIVYMPQSSYMLGNRVELTCVSSNSDNIEIRKYNRNYNNQFVAYEPGEYTMRYTVVLYDDMGGSVSKSKDFVITAVNKKDHMMHEFPAGYNALYIDNNGIYYHVKQCFCGKELDKQPCTLETKAVPYLDGTTIYFKRCSECGRYYAVDAKKSKTLTDEDTGTKITDIEGDAIPDGAQLNVDDVTDTEKVDLKNVSKVYDISLKSGGVEIQPNNDIAVTIPVPEKVNGEKAKVNRKEADGSFTDMNAVYNPQSKTLTFVTDHLSIYAITGGDVLLGDVNGDGKINNTDIIILGRSYMAGTGAQYLDIADMNSDKKINNTDIILLGRLYMSMTVQ